MRTNGPGWALTTHSIPPFSGDPSPQEGGENVGFDSGAPCKLTTPTPAWPSSVKAWQLSCPKLFFKTSMFPLAFLRQEIHNRPSLLSSFLLRGGLSTYHAVKKPFSAWKVPSTLTFPPSLCGRTCMLDGFSMFQFLLPPCRCCHHQTSGFIINTWWSYVFLCGSSRALVSCPTTYVLMWINFFAFVNIELFLSSSLTKHVSLCLVRFSFNVGNIDHRFRLFRCSFVILICLSKSST